MQACAAVVVLLLATAVAIQAQSPQGNREKGQAPESCYESRVTNGTVVYTRSAGPRETTFTFLVRRPGETLLHVIYVVSCSVAIHCLCVLTTLKTQRGLDEVLNVGAT